VAAQADRVSLAVSTAISGNFTHRNTVVIRGLAAADRADIG